MRKALARKARSRVMRRPLVNALWLEAMNQLRSGCSGRRIRTWVALAGIAGALASVIALADRIAPALLRIAAPHPLTVDVLVALQASVLIHRGRRKWAGVYSSNWLSTLPVSRRESACLIALRTLLGSLAALALPPLVVVLAWLTAPASGAAVSALLGGMGIATVTGALLGWYLPQRDAEHLPNVPPHTVGAGPSALPTLAGLSYWAVTQTRVWLQPRSLSRLLLPAMLLLPGDISGNVAVALLSLWVLALYLSVLLRATVRVAREGATWLRPTSLTFYRFAWAVARRPLLKQLQWSLVATGLLIALGCQPVVAARVAEWWLALITVISGVALARTYQSGAMRLRLVVSVCALTLLEGFRQHLALLGALLISAWHIRGAARA